MPGISYSIRIALICAGLAGLSPAAAQQESAPAGDWLQVQPLKPGDKIVCVDRATIAKHDGLTYFEAAFCKDVDEGNGNASRVAFEIDCATDWSDGGEMHLGPVGGEMHSATVSGRENGAALAQKVCEAVAS